ncbi:SH3 domain-containing protein 19 isoform X2 [Pristis pectinata]|uniref:SH3 domain-containing protein 19 isoform X2 n=1 Tax=Pristis pectinata TaxID=685728 RepID=UPI00223D8607|nr:SH3 domain-containing protein 19 isoform X2 [Pristis pectinata]
MMMAEAWIQEEEEEVRGASDRDPGSRHHSAAARRTGASSADRSDRNKPDQSSRNSSHGPLSSIRAAIKRTSSRTSSQSELRRERRRPAITVLSAEPIGPSPWYPGVPGNCVAPIGVGASYPRTLWRIDEPTAAEPPPSYEQVIREISQQPVPTPPALRHSTATISTQTEFDQDTEDLETRSADADFACLRETPPVTVPVKPSRSAVCLIPIRLEENEAPLISIESDTSREQSVQTNTNVAERPIPRPRSLGNFKVLFQELQLGPSEEESKGSFSEVSFVENCQIPIAKDNFTSQDTMEDSSGQGILSRIKAFETQTNSESFASNAQPSKRPEVAPRTLVPKPAVGQGRPTIAPKPPMVDKISGESNNGVEAKPVAAERQGPIVLPKPQIGSTAVGPKPEPPKKPKSSISMESKQNDQTCSILDIQEEELSNPVTTQRERPAVWRNQMPIPAPRPTMAKRTTPAENRIAPSTITKPPITRPSVLPITKTSVVDTEGSSTNKHSPPLQISSKNPFQTLPRGQAPPTDVIPNRPPLLRKPTVIRIPNKPSKTSSDDIASPPPLPAETPVGNFIAERPKAVAMENCDLPRPVASQPLARNIKVPPARPAPAKAGPARPPPPKVSAAPNQFRRFSSEQKINSTVGKRSPSTTGKTRPKSQVFQKKGPELPPRPAPGHPLYNKYMLPVPHGIAECNISSKVPGELSFQRGEVLVLKQRIDQSFHCQKGLDTGKVASSHLKIITPLDEEEVKGTGKKSFTSDLQFGDSSAPRALVLHDFTADQNDELNLKAGDTVYLLKKLDKDWFSGKCKGHTGIFPANFVKVIVDLPVGDSQDTSVKKDLFKSASLTKGPQCVARFDFEGDQPDELTFFEGDVIALKEYVSEEWARGELKGRTGIFPLNFVDLIENLPTSEQKTIQNSPLSPGSNRPTGVRPIETSTSNQVGDLDLQWCEALYDFKAEAADDLPFKRGDRILILEQIDSEWCKGKLNGLEGIFPSAFVRFCSGTTGPVKQQSSGNKRGMAKALYNFVGENEDELNFKVGDTIILLESIDADWLKGELHGKEGIFPRNFVQVLKDPL